MESCEEMTCVVSAKTDKGININGNGPRKDARNNDPLEHKSNETNVLLSGSAVNNEKSNLGTLSIFCIRSI